MGYQVTTVCAAAAYTYTYTLYGFGLGDFGETAIVAGGNCAFSLSSFYGDNGSRLEVLNITSPGQSQFEPFACNFTGEACVTNYNVFQGPGYFQPTTFDFITVNSTGVYNAGQR